MSAPPDSALFVGRLHVLLVHLPIAFILLLAILEVLALSSRFRHANTNAGLVLLFAVPAAVFSAACGWLLSLSGGYDSHLLQWHKWTGISTAAICVVAVLFYRLNLKRAYRASVLLSLPVLLVASHFGGSLTHGSDYLVRYAPAPFRTWLGTAAPQPKAAPKQPDPAQTALFAGVVQPILKQNCVSCHGPEKSKGGLRLDSFEAMLKGGENGPVIVPGKAADSLALKRLHLPLESDDHMPPGGKPQPSAGDISLLQWWVDSGAPTNKAVREFKLPLNISRILEVRLGIPSRMRLAAPAVPLPAERVLPLASKLADALGISIARISETEPWLECNASMASTNFGDQQLAELAPLRSNLRWLDLAGTAVTDSGTRYISEMPNLTRLHLERTSISDQALASLSSLPQLEYLNLHSTEVTDSGLASLQELPRLKQLYLWQTKVSPEAATNFADARIDKDQIALWRDQIAQLTAKIQDARFLVDIGVPTVMATSTNAAGSTNMPVATTSAAPANTVCPVSGKAVDATKTVEHEGKLIAFCCDDCKAKWLSTNRPPEAVTHDKK